MRKLFALFAFLALAACESATEPTPENTTFAPQLGVDLDASTRLDGGLYYRDLTVGDGTLVQNGARLSVHYRGWLANGSLFDQRQPPQQPFEFTVGTDNVIAGWHRGVVGMRVGGVRQLIIPPGLAYGDRAYGPIPASSVLVFEVSAVAVQ